MPKVLNIIRDEHRSIAAVLHGMQYLIEQIRTRNTHVDSRVFRAMLYYLDTFAERVHHPKEELYLFETLRRRGTGGEDLLAELGKEHFGGEQAVRRLEQSLTRYEEGGESEFPAFAREVSAFAEAYWAHMRKEEEQVFPLAEARLTAEDWAAMDREFEGNRDPLAAERETRDFQKLFTRIVDLAPPPIGVGPAD